METKGSSSGLTQIWKLWRHCCCRFGPYPLLIAPLVTISCLLDLYSTFDCEFLKVNVGFRPSNIAWNQTTATVGLFQFQMEQEKSVWDEVLVEGCKRYSDEFYVQFIDGDRTWEVAQVVSYISGISGLVATATAWLLVVTPLPVCLFWPGVLLPSILVSFLSEGSKFLFLDTAICQSSIWYPSGADSLPQSARTCSLGKSAYFAISAGICFFICLILVCFKSPEKRKLDDEFGETNEYLSADNALDTSVEEDFGPDNDIETNLSNIQPDDSFVIVQKQGQPDYASSLGDEGSSFEYPQFGGIEDDSFFDNMNKSVLGEGSGLGQHDSFAAEPSFRNTSFENRYDSTDELISKPSSSDSDDPKYPTKTPAPEKAVEEPTRGTRVISQARLAKAEDMALQTNSSDDLIEKCVMRLTKSFQNDDLEKSNVEDVSDS